MTKIKGKHELQFGFHFRYDQMNLLPQQQQGAGSDSWDSNSTSLYDPTTSRNNPQPVPFTGDQFANFYLGLGNYNNQLNRGLFYARSKEYAGYFQDNWRVSSRLTLNLGLRYDFFPPYYEKNNAVSSFDRDEPCGRSGYGRQQPDQAGLHLPVHREPPDRHGHEVRDLQAGGPAQAPWSTARRTASGRALGFAYRAGQTGQVVRGPRRLPHLVLPLRAGRLGSAHAPERPHDRAFLFQRDAGGLFAGRHRQPQPAHCAHGHFGPEQRRTWCSPPMRRRAWLAVVAEFPTSTKTCRTRASRTGTSPWKRRSWPTRWRAPVISATTAPAWSRLYQYNSSTPAYIWYTTTGQAAAHRRFRQRGHQFLRPNRAWVHRTLAEHRLGQLQRHPTGVGAPLLQGLRFPVVLRDGQHLHGRRQRLSDHVDHSGSEPVPARPGPHRSRRAQQVPELPARHRHSASTACGGTGWWTCRSARASPFWATPARCSTGSWAVGRWPAWALSRALISPCRTPCSPTGNKLEVYGYKYPIQDCTSGACYPGYLWYNGYIPSNQINSVDANGKPNGYMGIPANYKPAVAAAVPYRQTALPPQCSRGHQRRVVLRNTNTVWVPLKDGTTQRTT